MVIAVETLNTLSPADRQRLVEIWEDAVRATHDFLTEDDIQFFKPLVRDAYLDSVQLACLRSADGQIAGFIGSVGDRVEMLFVDPARHGRGIGRALMERAMALGARSVDVNEQNPQAVGFYLRLGFVQYDRSEVDGSGKPFPILHLRKD
ncbi:GNAT family N-acetyltransferase [Pseudomonas sp. JS3066]|jgi:putative acetyltransferase|uniref:GNAT family N-acetyltransferase n=1 Tax=unclassified Pseudomonas TaxID=196821 RepID=UPI000EA93FEB|nr:MULTISPECIES: GNAT family N-acetyltransferase [unclassified Pseudomonas]AYF89805.1 GNAT family N-acetyltransferase [Pseudomonas sp. DY-1]MDH4655205.1 GNAT family N-acetyltransferase [Pseudomonas sp. BN606]MRK20280.1 GNAT family N-acetyltransferase [Pseudomonas sp. JG-B]WVK92616.1 GNAT family N-acetyltransferase [Pseudomonas sp. JS3066]